jgi:hypothetical protein
MACCSGAKYKPELIRRQTEQGVDRREAHRLILIIEHRAEQQAALSPRNQADDALYRSQPDSGLLVLQVGIGQFQSLRARVVGQFSMQPDATLDREVGAPQLLIQLACGPRLPGPRGIKGFAVAVFDRVGHRGSGAAQGQPGNDDDKYEAEADEQVAAGLGHADFRKLAFPAATQGFVDRDDAAIQIDFGLGLTASSAFRRSRSSVEQYEDSRWCLRGSESRRGRPPCGSTRFA